MFQGQDCSLPSQGCYFQHKPVDKVNDSKCDIPYNVGPLLFINFIECKISMVYTNPNSPTADYLLEFEQLVLINYKLHGAAVF